MKQHPRTNEMNIKSKRRVSTVIRLRQEAIARTALAAAVSFGAV